MSVAEIELRPPRRRVSGVGLYEDGDAVRRLIAEHADLEAAALAARGEADAALMAVVPRGMRATLSAAARLEWPLAGELEAQAQALETRLGALERRIRAARPATLAGVSAQCAWLARFGDDEELRIVAAGLRRLERAR